MPLTSVIIVKQRTGKTYFLFFFAAIIPLNDLFVGLQDRQNMVGE